MQVPDEPARHDRASFAHVLRWESLFRHKLAALATGLVVVALTLAFLWVRDRSYESMARVFVRLGREAVTVDPTASATGQVLTVSESQQREIQSAIDILESRGLAEHVVDTLGPSTILDYVDEAEAANAAPPPEWAQRLRDGITQFRATLVPRKLADPPNPRAKAIEAVQKSMKVSTEHLSNVVTVSVKTDSPKLAQRLSETLLAGFQDRYMSAHRSPGAAEFFQQQTGRVKASLDQVTCKLRDAKNDAGLSSTADQKLLLANRLKDIDAAIVQVTADQEGSKARLKNMEQTLALTPERVVSQQVTGLTNTSRDDMRGRLYQVELELAELRSVYSDEHPLVKKAKEKVRQAQDVLGEERTQPEVTMALNQSYQQVKLAHMLEQSQMASHAARLAELAKQREGVAAEIRLLNEREVMIDDLERERSLLDTKYRRYVENMEQTRIDGALEQSRLSSINIIQPPSLNEDPVDPSNSLVALGGCICAMMAAVAMSLGLEYLRNDLTNSSDVERVLAMPVLAAIPWTRKHHVAMG